MKKGVMMRCKTITANLLKIVHLIVETITYFENPKATIEASLSIQQPPWRITSSKPVISPSLSRIVSFRTMLRYNRHWWSTVLRYVRSDYGHCRGGNTTGNELYGKKKLSLLHRPHKEDVFFFGLPVSVEKGLLYNSWSSLSKNSLIPINFYSGIF